MKIMSTNPWTGAAIALTLLATACSQPQDPNKLPGAAGSASPGNVTATSTPSLARSAEPTGYDEESAPAPPAEKFGDGARAFAAVRETLLKSYYADGLTEDDLFRAATQGMLERFDPKMHKWNKLLSPGDVSAIRNDLKGELIGIGARIHFESQTGYTDIEGTIAGSPAERAGLGAGDRILTINGKFFKGMSQMDVLGAIRGKVGDVVTLSVLRGDKIINVPVKRDVVAFDPVTAISLTDGIGYMRVRSFNAKTVASLRATLEDFGKKGARALVLDLRDNPGGGFDDAIACAELLVPAGAGIVTLRKRDQREETTVSKGTPILASLPLVVLVDHGTSSGAELVTAALQESRHATVVGSRTFGKWSVQKIDDLPNGYAFKYTASLFKSASGKSFDGVGLTPDVEVDMDAKLAEKAQAITDPEKRLAADSQLRTAVGIVKTRL